MPEIPDLTLYLEAIDARFVGSVLERVRVASPFLLRSVEPRLSAVEGKVLRGTRRLGQRLVLTEASPKKRASLHVVRGEDASQGPLK